MIVIVGFVCPHWARLGLELVRACGGDPVRGCLWSVRHFLIHVAFVACDGGHVAAGNGACRLSRCLSFKVCGSMVFE